MSFNLKPSDLAFLDARERCAHVTVTLAAAPERVFAALADQSTWRSWCADLVEARWITAEASCVGATRSARFRFATFEERILAWDPPRRFAFSVDTCTVPIARRAAEDWRLREVAGLSGAAGVAGAAGAAGVAGGAGTTATELSWDLVVDVPPLARPAWPAARLVVEAAFKKTAAGLARYLR